jgi:hypothetical protein
MLDGSLLMLISLRECKIMAVYAYDVIATAAAAKAAAAVRFAAGRD